MPKDYLVILSQLYGTGNLNNCSVIFPDRVTRMSFSPPQKVSEHGLVFCKLFSPKRLYF